MESRLGCFTVTYTATFLSQLPKLKSAATALVQIDPGIPKIHVFGFAVRITS
jgi:hypothetical protein